MGNEDNLLNKIDNMPYKLQEHILQLRCDLIRNDIRKILLVRKYASKWIHLTSMRLSYYKVKSEQFFCLIGGHIEKHKIEFLRSIIYLGLSNEPLFTEYNIVSNEYYFLERSKEGYEYYKKFFNKKMGRTRTNNRHSALFA